LYRIFCSTRFARRLERHGYARFRHWRLYGELGLGRASVAVWVYGEHLTLEYADEILSYFTVTYQPDGQHLRTVAAPQVFETAYRSPQLALWDLSDDEWRKALPVPSAVLRRRAHPEPAMQPSLFAAAS
jgi:hypothetical protein